MDIQMQHNENELFVALGGRLDSSSSPQFESEILSFLDGIAYLYDWYGPALRKSANDIRHFSSHQRSCAHSRPGWTLRAVTSTYCI